LLITPRVLPNNLFKEVGADGAAGDAVSAVALAKSLFAI
jgi:methanogenic corrinoid protein MtbC1